MIDRMKVIIQASSPAQYSDLSAMREHVLCELECRYSHYVDIKTTWLWWADQTMKCGGVGSSIATTEYL